MTEDRKQMKTNESHNRQEMFGLSFVTLSNRS
jgi:hypothetical protein